MHCTCIYNIASIKNNKIDGCQLEVGMAVQKIYINKGSRLGIIRWDPYYVKDRELLEKTQKFGLKVCLKDWSSDYTSLLSKANIHLLSMRRSQARLCHMFKIMHKLTDFPDVPIDLRTFHYNSRSDNSMAITPFQCQSTQFLNSFFPRTASQWNSLPKSVVSKNTITSFKQSVTNFI